MDYLIKYWALIPSLNPASTFADRMCKTVRKIYILLIFSINYYPFFFKIRTHQNIIFFFSKIPVCVNLRKLFIKVWRTHKMSPGCDHICFMNSRRFTFATQGFFFHSSYQILILVCILINIKYYSIFLIKGINTSKKSW